MANFLAKKNFNRPFFKNKKANGVEKSHKLQIWLQKSQTGNIAACSGHKVQFLAHSPFVVHCACDAPPTERPWTIASTVNNQTMIDFLYILLQASAGFTELCKGPHAIQFPTPGLWFNFSGSLRTDGRRDIENKIYFKADTGKLS